MHVVYVVIFKVLRDFGKPWKGTSDTRLYLISQLGEVSSSYYSKPFFMFNCHVLVIIGLLDTIIGWSLLIPLIINLFLLICSLWFPLRFWFVVGFLLVLLLVRHLRFKMIYPAGRRYLILYAQKFQSMKHLPPEFVQRRNLIWLFLFMFSLQDLASHLHISLPKRLRFLRLEYI